MLGAALIVGAGVSIIGQQHAAAATKAQLERERDMMKFSSEMSGEKLKSSLIRAESGFAQDFGKRLNAYNSVRNTQLVTAGYQMRTVDSLSAVMEADEMKFDYDNQLSALNQSLNAKALTLDNTMTQLGYASDYESSIAAQNASKTAATWAAAGTITSAATTYATYQ